MTNVLLSYPRSGNSWIRYCAEILSGRPTSAAKGQIKNPVLHKIGTPVLVKAHRINNLSKWSKTDNLVLIIRNPKECILKHILDREKCEAMIDKEIRSFTHCLYVYEQWQGSKHVFYYEDIILDPYKHLPGIMRAFGIEQNMDDFFTNYQKHVDKSVKLYAVGPNTSDTHGSTNLQYHQNRHPHFASMIQSKLITNHKHICNEFLLRYISK